MALFRSDVINKDFVERVLRKTEVHISFWNFVLLPTRLLLLNNKLKEYFNNNELFGISSTKIYGVKIL